MSKSASGSWVSCRGGGGNPKHLRSGRAAGGQGPAEAPKKNRLFRRFDPAGINDKTQTGSSKKRALHK